jgi:hypothetical protein
LSEDYFENVVGRGWFKSFLSRHKKDILTGYKKHLEEARAKLTRGELKEFFDLERREGLNEIDPRLCFEMDETMVEYNLGSKRNRRVVIPRDHKYGVRFQDPDSKHVTLVALVCSDGSAAKPALILPLKYFPHELDDFADSFDVAGSPTGWMNTAILTSWVEKCLIPFINLRRFAHGIPDATAMLRLDGHTSRFSAPAWDLCKRHNIRVHTYVAHSTHICCGLDVVIFRLSSRSWSITRL